MFVLNAATLSANLNRVVILP